MVVREVIDDAAADEPVPRGEAGPREAGPVSPISKVESVRVKMKRLA
ncbi:hypothetical protein ACPCTO_36430 [Streptomyces olivoreticuli]